MSYTEQCFRLTRDVSNSAYDRRCRHGIRAMSRFPAGTLWLKMTPDESIRAVMPNVLYSTPWGNVVNYEDKKALDEHSEVYSAKSVDEILYIYQQDRLLAAELLKHLEAEHGWGLNEIEQVVAEIQKKQANEAGA